MGKDRRKKKMHQSPSSSSRRETSPGNRSGQINKTIGCMSGLLQLFSRQHSRRRIPSGNSQSQPPMSSIEDPQPEFTEMKTNRTPANGDARISGCENRSPTLPLEIRRSGRCFDDVHSPRRSSALLARLMGLEEPPPPPPPPPPPSTTAVGLSVDSAEEKRRTLLGALERCDEDLRSLKLIIDAIRTVEMRRSKFAGELKCIDGNGENPSPVSVIDASWSPKSRSSENASTVPVARSLFYHTNGGGGGGAEKKGWKSVVAGCSPKHRMMAEGIPRIPAENKGVKDHAGSAIPAAAKDSGGRLWQLRRRTNQAEDRKETTTVIAELADDVAVDLVNSIVMEQVEYCSKLSCYGKV